MKNISNRFSFIIGTPLGIFLSAQHFTLRVVGNFLFNALLMQSKSLEVFHPMYVISKCVQNMVKYGEFVRATDGDAMNVEYAH